MLARVYVVLREKRPYIIRESSARHTAIPALHLSPPHKIEPEEVRMFG